MPYKPINRQCVVCGESFLAHRPTSVACGPLCGGRLATSRRAPNPSLWPSFWTKVAVGEPDACWPWQGGTDKNGYGRRWHAGRERRAHVVAFFLTHAFWPRICCHSCNNPPCCNPAHLRDDDTVGNARDMVLAERAPRMKLTIAQVREARALYAGGGMTQAALARRFGLSPGGMHAVLNGSRWRYV